MVEEDFSRSRSVVLDVDVDVSFVVSVVVACLEVGVV